MAFVDLPYRIEYSPDAETHLLALTARQRAVAVGGIEKHLTYQPMIETRNRKPMRPNPLAPWELRIGNMRVYFDAKDEPEAVVLVRAVGIKSGNRVRIGGKDFES